MSVTQHHHRIMFHVVCSIRGHVIITCLMVVSDSCDMHACVYVCACAMLDACCAAAVCQSVNPRLNSFQFTIAKSAIKEIDVSPSLHV